MSTIASPRPSISASSRRTSTSTTATNTAPAVDRGSLRRNRAALRDYYNLQAAPSSAVSTPPTVSLDVERESQLDKPDFDLQKYISTLLAEESVDGVLKVEAGLVSEARSLDGEKKALVYENFSKVTVAIDTIRIMREKMDPLTPATSTLTPAIAHIAETAATLSNDLKKSHAWSATSSGDVEAQKRSRNQRDTVKWVLAAPRRMEEMIDDGRREDAETEWDEVRALLEKWKGVKGVNEVGQACVAVLRRSDDG